MSVSPHTLARQSSLKSLQDHIAQGSEQIGMVSSSYKKGFPHAWGREASIKSVLLNCNHGQKRLNWPKLKKGGGFDTACKEK